MKWNWLIGLTIGMTFLPSVACFGQMEKREDELYRLNMFMVSYPAVGQMAPDLEIKNMEGETVSLSDYRGKNLVLIKGGYT